MQICGTQKQQLMESNTTNIFPKMLKAFGMAVAIFLLVNLIGFFYLLFKKGWGGDFAFKWGSFYLNGETTGPVWGSSNATFLIFASFCYFLYKFVEKQRANPNA